MCNASRISFVLVSAIALISTSGCASRRDHTQHLKGVKTKEIVLDPKNTRAPELRLRVPEAFEVDWTPDAGPDTFIIFDPNVADDVAQ
ncbi:MAG: hypothetical protein H7X80_02140, partial [bacterium]|nr:hypothetical protein [Candidatus Kapabacteria bacterium]